MDLVITTLPVVTKDLPISPRFTPYDFLSRCKFSTLTIRQPMVEFYLLTFPRFPLRKKGHKSYFGKNRTHDFRTSRCAVYLLDHSSDECHGTDYVHRLSCCKSHLAFHRKLLLIAVSNMESRSCIFTKRLMPTSCNRAQTSRCTFIPRNARYRTFLQSSPRHRTPPCSPARTTRCPPPSTSATPSSHVSTSRCRVERRNVGVYPLPARRDEWCVGSTKEHLRESTVEMVRW